MTDTEQVDPWVDSKRVAAHTQKSIFTVRNRAKSGEWPAVKDGRDWMFKLSEVDAALRGPSEPVDLWQSSRSRKRT